MVTTGQAVSEEIVKYFPMGYYVKTMSADVSSLGWQQGSSDTILERNHPKTIQSKFGLDWPSSFIEKNYKFFPLGFYVKQDPFLIWTCVADL